MRKSDLHAVESYGVATAVTPHDTDSIAATDALSIGVSGTLKVTINGSDVSFGTVPVGILPVRVTRVFSTGTTAASIVALNYGT